MPDLTPIVVTETANGITVTITSDPTAARLLIDLQGGPVGDPVYVLRRDRNGTTLVRETSAGTVLWQAGTPTTVPTVSEYEARQGLETDFIVTDLDGLPLVSVRITIPTWGTWVKNPGRPGRNVKCLWRGDRDYTRQGRRTLIQPRGAKYPIALSDRRTAPVGSVQLKTVDQETARALTTLIDDGQVLMIDVPLEFGVPVRYVSVGAVTGSRIADGAHGDTRFWTLEVDEVAAPTGLPAGQGFTYEGLAALADSYIAVAATFASYDDVAVGLET